MTGMIGPPGPVSNHDVQRGHRKGGQRRRRAPVRQHPGIDGQPGNHARPREPRCRAATAGWWRRGRNAGRRPESNSGCAAAMQTQARSRAPVPRQLPTGPRSAAALLRATQTMAEAIRHLNKADRAAALDLGEDVFRQHHDAATRWNRQAQQQFRTVIERIDDRRSQDDWAGLVEQVRVEFPNRNGPQQLQDLAAEVKQVLLDADRLSGPDTAECVVIIDRSTSALIERGLSGILRSYETQLRAPCGRPDIPTWADSRGHRSRPSEPPALPPAGSWRPSRWQSAPSSGSAGVAPGHGLPARSPARSPPETPSTSRSCGRAER